MKLEELKVLGLSNGEVKVYGAILELGISTINKIHEKTGLERRAIYDIINKLIEKGMITYTLEKGKRTYQCAPPNRLNEKLQTKQKELLAFEKTIPHIQKLYENNKPQVAFEIFRGPEGIKNVFEDMLNHRDIYVIGGGFYIVRELPHYWPQYNKRRKKAKTTWHNLVRSEFEGKIPEKELVNVKFLPQEFSENPVVILIFGDKVANLLWGEEWFAFVIESKDVAENYKKYHSFLWSNIAQNK